MCVSVSVCACVCPCPCVHVQMSVQTHKPVIAPQSSLSPLRQHTRPPPCLISLVLSRVCLSFFLPPAFVLFLYIQSPLFSSIPSYSCLFDCSFVLVSLPFPSWFPSLLTSLSPSCSFFPLLPPLCFLFLTPLISCFFFILSFSPNCHSSFIFLPYPLFMCSRFLLFLSPPLHPFPLLLPLSPWPLLFSLIFLLSLLSFLCIHLFYLNLFYFSSSSFPLVSPLPHLFHSSPNSS